MPFIVLTRNVPQSPEVAGLKQSLITAINYANNVNRQLDQMTDQQVSDQFGVPLSAVAAFRTNIDGILAALSTSNVTNIISSLGFDQ